MGNEEQMTDPHEAFVRAFARHESTLRAFVRAMLGNWEDVDEVMQEVAVVAWKKFHSLDDLEQFPRWLCVIARYEVLKYRRAKVRDRLVLNEDIVQLLAEEGLDELPLRQRQHEALEGCLDKLPEARRKLVLQAYAPGVSIKQMAEQVGRSPAALYQLLSRIRRELVACVERSLAEEVGA